MEPRQVVGLAILTATLLMAMSTGCTPKAKRERLMKQADSDFKEEKYDAAKIQYLNALKGGSQDASAIARVGEIWSEQGAPIKAIPFLLKAREQTPDDLKSRLRLASSFLAVGEVGAARKEALAVLEQAPTNEKAIMLLGDTAWTKELIKEAEQRLQKLPAQDTAAFQLTMGNLFLRKGDAASSEKALQRALTLDAKSPFVHLALANLHLYRRDLTKAAEEFKATADFSPVRSYEHLKYAEFQVQVGAVEEAKAFLKEATRQAPDYLPAWCLLAHIAFVEKKYDESLGYLANVFGREHDNLDARVIQNQVWLAQGEVKKALEGMERVNQAYPNMPVMKFRMAQGHLLNNNLGQAALLLSQALEINPDYTEAKLLLGEVQLRTGEAAAVVPAMEGLLKKQPGLRPAERLLAEAYVALGRREEAAAVFRRQIAADPGRSAPYFQLGLILQQQQKVAEARAAFEKAQELDPESLLPVELLVELDLLQRDFDAAMRRVERQLQRAPASPGAHVLKGKVHGARAEWDLAEAALLKALQLDPNFIGAYDLLIATYVAANRLPQAISQVEVLLAKKPDSGTALMLAGMLYDKTGAFPKARDAYEKVLGSEPEFVPALNNLAYLYAERLNQPERAYELARKARNLQPEDPAIADTLGWILHQRADYPQALTLLAESAGKLPNNAEIQYHLGMASYMMGQTDAARTALAKAAQAPVDFPGKADIARRLALLGGGAGGSKELTTEELEALVGKQPDDPIAQVKLGEAYEKQAAFAKAAAAYEQALLLSPRLPTPNIRLAQLYAGPLGNRVKALEFARKARDLAPTDPRVAGILGGIAAQTGNFVWAYSLLQDSVRSLPKDPAILAHLASAAYGLGKTTEARQTMERVLAATPTAAQTEDAQSFLALTALDPATSNLAATEPVIEKALKADPQYLPALMARAAGQTQRGDAQAAAAIYAGILQRLPDFPLAQKQLAALWAGDPNNLGKAHELAVKARKALPEDPESSSILAEITYHQKDFPTAIRLFQESARKKPLNPQALYYLGLAHLQAKQKTQGRDALQRALQNGLPEPLAADAKRTLAEK